MAAEQELIMDEYISKLEPLTVKIKTRSGPRTIICQDYFIRSRMADIRAMFNEAEHRISENGEALHKIRVWLKKSGEAVMKMFRYANVIYGNGQAWNDLKALRGKGATRKQLDDAQHENNRQDDHLKVAMRMYEKIVKAAEHEMLLEERNSWVFKDYYEFK